MDGFSRYGSNVATPACHAGGSDSSSDSGAVPIDHRISLDRPDENVGLISDKKG